MIHRNISNEITERIKYYPIVTLTGPRQSGKTTLCRALFPDYHYINMEQVGVREQIKADTQAFLNRYPNVIIDEVHHYPEILSYIQVTVDEYPERRFVLTGSSNFQLLQNITQSLAGRTTVLTLLPLSLNELGSLKDSQSTDSLILRGGYPAVWSKGYPHNIMYQDYYTTYVERDVRQIINIKDIDLFQRFIRLSAGRIGSEFNASALSGETGVAVSTIISWLSILKASYIVYTLQPYFANIGKRLTKTPKIYFYDTGLAAYLLGIETEEQLQVHPLRGNLFENMIVNEALKSRMNRGKDANLYFYRDKSQREVDLVHTTGNTLSAYEIKSSKTFNPDFFKGINYIKDIFKDRLTRSAVIYGGDTETPADEKGVINYRNFYLE